MEKNGQQQALVGMPHSGDTDFFVKSLPCTPEKIPTANPAPFCKFPKIYLGEWCKDSECSENIQSFIRCPTFVVLPYDLFNPSILAPLIPVSCAICSVENPCCNIL